MAENGYKHIQCVVAADNFHGLQSVRFDTVLVDKCEKEDERSCVESILCC